MFFSGIQYYDFNNAEGKYESVKFEGACREALATAEPSGPPLSGQSLWGISRRRTSHSLISPALLPHA